MQRMRTFGFCIAGRTRGQKSRRRSSKARTSRLAKALLAACSRTATNLRRPRSVQSPPGFGLRQSSGAFAWRLRGVWKNQACPLRATRGKSGRGLPQSKTLARVPRPLANPPGFRLRQSSGAFARRAGGVWKNQARPMRATRWKSGRGLPQSTTLARAPRPLASSPGFWTARVLWRFRVARERRVEKSSASAACRTLEKR